MRTIHMVGNAHMDPVWLWGRSEGVDAVLATARSACDRLDEYQQFVFTCSGLWFHRQVELHDPALLERVRRFVQAGRWRIVGGMVVQPDCNLPSEESFIRQLSAGQGYYRRAFGKPTTVGYNVDSFGHTAYLPRFLRGAGIDSYVFMRPGPHEKQLPASLFRWRSPDGQEVLAFRIAGGYCTGAGNLRGCVEAALAGMHEKVDDTMCFYGVGDHGGGPTKAQIEWILSHADDIPGARLVLSHPRAFFDAVAGRAGELPVLADELQHHAIGCYSVERRIKVGMRRAEAKLLQAEQTLAALGDKAGEPGASAAVPGAAKPGASAPIPADVQKTVDRLWEAVLFNEFHDILGGTCIDRASLAAAGELAAAEAQAEELITLATRRAFRAEADPGVHKIVVFNPAGEPFDGYLEHEPWLYGAPASGLALVDEDGKAIPHQCVEPRGKMRGLTRILFRLSVPARSWRILSIVGGKPQAEPAPSAAGLAVSGTGLSSAHVKAVAAEGALRVDDWSIRLDVHDDPSDTWSHSCTNQFDGRKVGEFAWEGQWQAVEEGPLRAGVRRAARFDVSRLWCRLSATAGEPMLRMQLSVVWGQQRQRLVLGVTGPGKIERRMDLVSGGPLSRPIDGLEYPLNGATVVGTGGASLAVVGPEVLSLSVAPGGVGMTLLRSPFVAHHDPMEAELRPDHPVTDLGRHEFDLIFWPGCADSLESPARLARQMLAGPVVWDLTG